MPSTPSSRNRLNKQGTGDNVGSWGVILNAQVFDLLDEALDGVTTLTVTGNATLSSANYATDQARKRVLKLIGSPASTFILTIPGVEKYYLVHNTTAQPQTIKASGNGVTIPGNTMVPIYCDGTDCFSPTVGLTAAVGTVVDFAGSTAPVGWLFAAGQSVSRSTYSALFGVIGTTFGAGNGSTTFDIPDLRARMTLGRDNMGSVGTTTRVTAAVSGVAAATLGEVGGNQSLHSHTHGISDPSHTHGHSDPGHTHGHSDPGHTHTFSDPGHSHGYSEGGGGAGHRHTYNEPAGLVGVQAGAGAACYSTVNGGAATGYATTGIVISSATTGAGIVGNVTGITNVSAVTGITNTGAFTGITGTTGAGGGASQNMPPLLVLNKIIYAGV